jgi:hypothetical protein
MPSFFIFMIKVVRFSPSLAAALQGKRMYRCDDDRA